MNKFRLHQSLCSFLNSYFFNSIYRFPNPCSIYYPYGIPLNIYIFFNNISCSTWYISYYCSIFSCHYLAKRISHVWFSYNNAQYLPLKSCLFQNYRLMLLFQLLHLSIIPLYVFSAVISSISSSG